MNLDLREAFERVVVLNLDRRPDRLAAVRAELDRFGVAFERIAAIDGRMEPWLSDWQAYARQPLVDVVAGEPPIPDYRAFYLGDRAPRARVAFVEQRSRARAIATPGAYGLLLSMTRLVERALEEGWRSVLIFEDDVLLHRASGRLFDRAYRQLPEDWVVLQLGALQLNWGDGWIERWSENLYRCHGSSIGAHAVGLRREALAPLLAACRRRDLPFDIGALHEVKRRFRERCFTILPNLAIQDASDSEIGMSTLFFREARKVDNLYRWHLPDYGPAGAASARPVDPLMTTPRPRLTRLPRRLGQMLSHLAGRRSKPLEPSPSHRAVAALQPPDGRRGPEPIRARAGSRPDATCVMVIVVGLPAHALEASISKMTSASAALPVFLTDHDDFELFRRQRAIFEYLPAVEPAPDLDVELYRLRRLALLRRKWQPVKIIALGADAARLVRLWRTSPFEDRRIEELTGGPSAADAAPAPRGADPLQ